MTELERHDLDARLAEALRARTRGDADVDQLWLSIIRTAEVTRQRPSPRWPRPAIRRRTWLLVMAGALLAGSIGVAGFMAGRPRVEPTPVGSRLGPIVVFGNGGWQSIDPEDGQAERTEGMGLVAVAASPTDVSWSPDGRRVAYAIGPAAVVFDRFAHTTTTIRRCTDAAGCGVAWSPDGRHIAVSVGGRMELVDPDGSHPTVLSDASIGRTIADPAWSPDGSRIAYWDPTGRTVNVMRADGAEDRRVSTPAADGTLEPQDLGWSADGSRIVFLGSDAWADAGPPPPGAGAPSPPWELRILSVPVSAEGVAPTVVDVVGNCYCLGFWPSFTVAPDGSAYAVNTLGMPIPGAAPRDGLFIIDAASLEARYLGDFSDSTVTWQPKP
jgi:WD40-like Beta Propeller Repeat